MLELTLWDPTRRSSNSSLSSLYKTLAGYGYCAQAEQIVIEGIPVQFIVPPFGLEEEALNSAVEGSLWSFYKVFYLRAFAGYHGESW